MLAQIFGETLTVPPPSDGFFRPVFFYLHKYGRMDAKLRQGVERRIEMSAGVMIRMAAEADAEEILSIYAPYVTGMAISFEVEVPTADEFAGRIGETLKKYPYIVALEEDRLVGYAYASAFKARAAYDWAVETSVYVKQGLKGKGVGKALYLALEELLRRQNILNLNACIAYSPVEDARLDHTSILFHQHMGYSKVAHFTKCGYKLGAWYDMIWMEKLIGEHVDSPEPFIPITQIPALDRER